MAERWSDSELETGKELKPRVRKLPERLQVDPKYKTYEKQDNAVIMVVRKCQAPGCTYKVGDNGRIENTAAAELEDLKTHLQVCIHVAGNNRNNNMKDPKIPVWVSGQSYESWVQNFTQWQDNVKYTDGQYVDRLTSMLKDPNTNKKVSDYFVNDLNEDRIEARDTCKKILERLKERFGRSELKELEDNIDKFRVYKFSDNAMESLNTLESIRGHWNKVLEVEKNGVTVKEIQANLDKIFKSVFVTEGRKKWRTF